MPGRKLRSIGVLVNTYKVYAKGFGDYSHPITIEAEDFVIDREHNLIIFANNDGEEDVAAFNGWVYVVKTNVQNITGS